MTDATALDVALANCADEPIHIPGRIQSFGAVIAYDLDSRQVLAYSENLGKLFPAAGRLSPGCLFDDLCPDREVIHAINGALAIPTSLTQRETAGRYQVHGHWVDVFVHQNSSQAIVEFEFLTSREFDLRSPVAHVRTMLAQLQGKSVQETLEASVRALRQLTGFDRVMAYRFLESGDGEVVAEARTPAVDPYLGLRYPASDIPVQVRELMLRTPFRIISDIRDPHVPLIQDPQTPRIDLSLAQLRGVSPIHVEYLENMGVRATMNTSIVVRGSLWGLFAFHHYDGITLAPERRTVCELFGHLVSLQIQQQSESEILSRRRRIASVVESINTGSTGGTESITDVFRHSLAPLQDIMRADGAAIVLGDQVLGHGSHPADNTCQLLSALQEHTDLPGRADDMVAIESLSEVPGLPPMAPTAGAFLLRITEQPRRVLMFFRNEIVSTVRWAGDADKQVRYGPNGPRLTPRESFNEYIASVSGRCDPWNPVDTAAAADVLTAAKQATLASLDRDQVRLIDHDKRQNLLMAELNHRVKNTLSLVRSIARQARDSSTSLEQYTVSFERRINALAIAHDLMGGGQKQWVGIRTLLELELRPYTDSGRQIELVGDDIALRADVSPLMALVIHELATNAAKHGALSDTNGSLRVAWRNADAGMQFDWHENVPWIYPAPTRRGFGMSLVEQGVPHQLGGECRVDFRADGLHVSFWLPAQSVVNRSATPGETPALALDRSPPAGPDAAPGSSRPALDPAKTIYVLEDNAVLAMDLVRCLEQAGSREAYGFGSEAQFRRAMGKQPPAVAVLDINLGPDTTSFALARELTSRNIPVVLVSGFNDELMPPEDLANLPRLTKPVNYDELITVLGRIDATPP